MSAATTTTSDNTPPSPEELLKTATAELSSLSRVSHRLALVNDSDRLQQVLEKLLPRLLKRIGDNHKEQLQLQSKLQQETANNKNSQDDWKKELKEAHDRIHAKLVEMLSHTMKRVKDDQACKLPCRDILALLLQQQEEASTQPAVPPQKFSTRIPKAKPVVDPFTLNLALAFLTLGVPRCSTRIEVEAMLPDLLVLTGYYSGLGAIRTAAKKMQSHQVAHLLLRAIEWLVKDDHSLRNNKHMPNYGAGASPNHKKTKTTTTKTTATAPTASSTAPATETPEEQTTAKSSMELARDVCQLDPRAAGAVFDLLLDGLLYQTVSGNVPPSGLSQAGHERLRQGNSTTARDWAAEKAPRMNLMEFKLALLDFISPSRRWAIFMGGQDDEGDDDGQDRINSLGVSRTVALLVVASGDPNVEVSQRATTYSKMHHDSFRGASNSSKMNSAMNSAQAAATTQKDGSLPLLAKGNAVGDSVCLTCGLLALALGQTNAESAMARIASTTTNIASTAAASDNANTWLGLPPDLATNSDSSQLVLSLKRRAASESTMATIMNYLADKIFQDNPYLLNDFGIARVQQLATLPLLVSQRTLSNLRTFSGLSVVQAKAYVAAAKLLNILCIRLASFYDGLSSTMHDDCEEKKQDGVDCSSVLLTLMARALSTACSILTPASSPMPSESSAMVSNEGNIAIRNACYGVLCTLSRSHFASAPESYIFTCGKTESVLNDGSKAAIVAIDTASLLFGCAANEVENLRPRAVAALDALLGAFCRVYCQGRDKPQDSKSEHANKAVTDAPLNPWASSVSDVHRNSSGDGNSLLLDKQGLTKAITPLLWSAGQTSQPKASRVAAARWSSDLLKQLDITAASHILCFLAGDKDVTAASIAQEGLGLPSKYAISSSDDDDFLMGGGLGGNAEENHLLPDFADYTAILFPAKSQESLSPSLYWRPQYWDFSFYGKAAALRFGLLCLFNDIYGGDDLAVKIYMSALADTLILFASKTNGLTEASKVQGREAIELLEECTRCLVHTLRASQYARSLLVKSSSSVAGEVSLSLSDIEHLALSANSAISRVNLSAAAYHLLEDLSLWTETTNPSVDMEDWLERSAVHTTLESCSKKLASMQQTTFVVGDIHGAAFLGAHCVRAFRLWANRSPNTTISKNADDGLEASCWLTLTSIIKSLGLGILNADDSIANACSDGLAVSLMFTTADAPLLDPRLYEGTGTALTHLATALKKFSGTDKLDAPRTCKLAHAAGKCLATTTSGAGSMNLGPPRLNCVDALFSLLGSPAFKADQEVGLIVGEALALYADSYAPDSTTWSSTVLAWPTGAFDSECMENMPPHEQALYRILREVYPSSSPHKKTACAPALLGLVGRAANGVNKDEGYARRFLVVEIKRHMAEIQGLFIALLSNPKSKQICRESCCLGLSACRGLTKDQATDAQSSNNLSTDELNHRLLRAFGTTNHGGSAYQETPEQAAARRTAERSESGATETGGANVMEQFGGEPEVGGQAGLGESALNSYKEMASAAVSLGRVDVLYALLILSVSHEAWFTNANQTKYGAAALLGEDSLVGSRTNSAELRTALRPHLSQLLPRILRACHDPNKQTREQMNSLWVGLTGGGSEARSAITQHLLPTIDTLIEDCANKLWRARTGACGALSEILSGRSWDDLGGGPPVLNDDDIHTKTVSEKLTAGIRLIRLFRAAMRALDDVRINVREAGETLARTVRGLSIRLSNPSLKEASDGTQFTPSQIRRHEVNASAASATTLRWLIKYGLNQQCDEAKGICLSTLVDLIAIVKPNIIQPLIPELLRSLLYSMSGLEPAALNYLQARSGSQSADSSLSYENLERVRLRLAQSGPLAMAVTKLLDMLPNVSLATQKEVAPQLDSVLRESVGFATRAATADAVTALSSTCPKAFQFSGTSNTNPSVRLLRALYFASERERGQTSSKMTTALGALAAHCPGSSVRILAMKACEKYQFSTGNNDDPTSRRASATALRSICVRASNQLLDGGPNDIWFRRVLPVAFLGQKDSDAKITKSWQEVWEEGSIVPCEDGFGTTLLEKLLPYLVKESCKALDALAFSRRVAGSAALVDLCAAGVLSPSPRQLVPSKADVNSMKRAQRRAQASHAALNASLKLLSGSRLWTGKSEVISSAVSIAAKWASASIDESLGDKVLLGWEKTGETCPWQPILVAPGKFSNDLFVNDNWFGQMHEKEEKDLMDDRAGDEPMDIDSSEVDGKLDIEEDCDKLTENEDDNHNSDAEERIGVEIRIVTFAGLARFLSEQAMPSRVSRNLTDSDEFLPYRVSAFKGLRDLMTSLIDSPQKGIEQKIEIYARISLKLVSLCDFDGRFISEDASTKTKEPPVLAARAIDCLAASFWQGIGWDGDIIKSGTSSVLELARFLVAAGGPKQSAWTVREASCLCLASLASTCHQNALRDHKVVSTFVECAVESFKDRKFWRVRFAGLKLVHALVSRAGTRPFGNDVSKGTEESDRQLLLEAILPQQDEILKLARKALSDPEAKVTALSSEVLAMISWWP